MSYSAVLAGFTPPYDSAPTERLQLAGASLLGNTNMDEFGMESGTLFSGYEFGMGSETHEGTEPGLS